MIELIDKRGSDVKDERGLQNLALGTCFTCERIGIAHPTASRVYVVSWDSLVELRPKHVVSIKTIDSEPWRSAKVYGFREVDIQILINTPGER